MAGMATGGKRMGRIRAVWVVGRLAAAAITAGCGADSPPEQSGTQRLTGRDFDHLFFWNEQTPAFTRQTTAPAGDSSQDFWVWPDGENAPLPALSHVYWSPPRWYSRVIAGDLLITGPYSEIVYDLQARTSVDLRTIADGSTLVPLDWASLRRDGGSIVAHAQTGELFAGRGSTFTFFPPPYLAWGADFMGDDLAVLASPSSSDPTSALIYRMTLPSGDLSPLPVPPLVPIFAGCLPFAMPPCKTFQVLGCGADDAVCAQTGRPPCAILYMRADGPTGVPQPYAFDVNTGKETALPSILAPSEFVLSPDRHSAAWAYAYDSSATELAADTPIYIQNFCTGAAVQCPMLGPRQITWRGDSQEVAVDLAGGQLGLVDVPTGTCSVLGAPVGSPHIDLHLFSPTNDRLAWTMLDSTSGSSTESLWLSDPAGHEPTMVASDVLGFTFSPNGQALFITRAHGNQLSLSWLSLLGADPPSEQLLADTFSGATLRGNQRVLVIDHWNTQDGSGNLDLVDLLSGTHRVLAHAVTDLAGDGSVDGAARVMYAVHGRFASAQDGLWQTTLPAP